MLIDSKKTKDAVEYPYIYGNNNTRMIYEDNFKKIILTGSFIGVYELINTYIDLRWNMYVYRLEEKININENKNKEDIIIDYIY